VKVFVLDPRLGMRVGEAVRPDFSFWPRAARVYRARQMTRHLAERQVCRSFLSVGLVSSEIARKKGTTVAFESRRRPETSLPRDALRRSEVIVS
jgi:hypothetical protein